MLLDLRWLLRKREHAQEALLLFCSLRRALEEKHYLAFYRLRRWLENHLRVSIRPRRDYPIQIVPLKLNRYCLEAISFQCLQAVQAELRPLLLAPKVEFSFRAEPSQDALTASDCGYSAIPLNPS